MVLNDTEINARIAGAAPLLDDHDPTRVKNCAYTLRAGKVFAPPTGLEEVINPAVGPFCPELQHIWQIGPSEVLVVRTRERVRMPADLCATYAPLYRLSRQGVMLLNASLVEPGYEGRLCCFLLNFSSQPVSIAPDDPIAKITFLTLQAPPGALVRETITDDAYHRGLANSAKQFQKSFMDVASIADRAVDKAAQSAKRAVVYGGIILGFLLAWAQFEPLVTNLIRKSVGWPTNIVERAADEKLKLELDSKMKELEFTRKSVQLENDIQTLKAELRDMKSKGR